MNAFIAFLIALNVLAVILAGCRYCGAPRREREFWDAFYEARR